MDLTLRLTGYRAKVDGKRIALVLIEEIKKL